MKGIIVSINGSKIMNHFTNFVMPFGHGFFVMPIWGLSDTVMGTAIGFWTGYLFSDAHFSKNFTLFTNGRAIDAAWKFQ